MSAKDGIALDRVVFMDEALACLRSEGMQAEIVPTPFEFQRGMTKMLKLKRLQ